MLKQGIETGSMLIDLNQSRFLEGPRFPLPPLVRPRQRKLRKFYQFRSWALKWAGETKRMMAKGTGRFRYDVKFRCSSQVLSTCFYGIQATYHDWFNAGVALRSKFDDERNTWLLGYSFLRTREATRLLSEDFFFLIVSVVTNYADTWLALPTCRYWGGGRFSRLMQDDANVQPCVGEKIVNALAKKSYLPSTAPPPPPTASSNAYTLGHYYLIDN